MGKYIGEIIIKGYKKEDPFKQSLWATDVSRFVYIIRETVNNETSWVRDKDAVKVKRHIIQPITEYIKGVMDDQIEKSKQIMADYYAPQKEGYRPNPHLTNHEQNIALGEFRNKINEREGKKYNTALGIIDIIDKNYLEKEILGKITPVFCPTNDLLAITK